MADYIPNRDLDFQQWAAHFVSECQGSGVTYGLTAAQVTALSTLLSEFDLALSDAESAKTQLKLAVLGKDEKRSAFEAKIRAAAAIIQADVDTTNLVRAAFGLPERGTGGSPIPVFTPGDVLVGAFSNGVNELKWNRNGNQSGTTYFVEYTLDLGATWQTAGITTRSKFSHEGQTPGQRIGYRVSALRANRRSMPSATVWVYANTMDGNVTYLDAAA